MVSVTINEHIFNSFLFWSAIITIKLLAMAYLTARARIRNLTFANPEDAAGRKGKVNFNCEAVERVRRNHLNDLENILPFFMVGLCYILSNPNQAVAVWHFRVFGISRICHTISYQYLNFSSKPRGISFAIGLFSCLSMAVQSVFYLYKFA